MGGRARLEKARGGEEEFDWQKSTNSKPSDCTFNDSSCPVSRGYDGYELSPNKNGIDSTISVSSNVLSLDCGYSP
jgi:hypothetical protein